MTDTIESFIARGLCAKNEIAPKAEECRPVVDCDRESWVKAQIACAIRMALAIISEKKVRADHPAAACAMDGLANGAAVEIIQTLGMEPGYINLRRIPEQEQGQELRGLRR